MVLSIIIPCYNEERTIAEVMRRVLAVDLPGIAKDVIVVDDGSRDASALRAWEAARAHPGEVRVLRLPENRGKGAAVRQGFREARGDLLVIQDADLEYDPEDFRQMLSLFRLPGVDVVFGSRRLLPNPISGALFYVGAQFINFMTNVLYGVRLSDQFSCYKMFRRSLLSRIPLRADGFEVDAELTAKLLRIGQRVQEVPITYRPRSRAEGKKVRFQDGVAWVGQLAKHRFTNPRRW